MNSPVPVQMDCSICGHSADYTKSARIQWDYMDEHYKLFHDKRRNNMTATLVQQIWHKLDDVMKTALSWPGPGSKPFQEPSDPFDWNTKWASDYGPDKIEYTKTTSIGRGLAESLVILCTPAFENSDQVVRLAVARYKAAQAGETMPDTPGFMGAGQTGDTLRVAGQGKESNVSGVVTPNTATSVVSTPTISPSKPSGPKSKIERLPEKAVNTIKKAAANGFDLNMFCDMYNLTKAEVQEVANA